MIERQNTFIVYKYTSPSGKIYIGKTSKKLENKRKNNHKHKAMNKESKNRWYRAIRKYGFENMKYEVLCYVSSNETALIMEEAIIKQFKSNDFSIGYNSNTGGIYASGYLHSKEAKKKISDANKGKIVSSETKEKIRKAKTNISEETRKKISDANKGKKHTDESKKKMSDSRKGIKHANFKQKEYYIDKPTLRDNFKATCNKANWEFDKFIETFVGFYVRPSGKRLKLYTYKEVI